MLRRLSLALAAAALIVPWKAAKASPLTYNFSGTFNGGTGAVLSGPFSGSFTIDSNGTLGSGGTISQNGSDVSFSIGNFSFANNSQNPGTTASFTVSDQPSAPQPVVADFEGKISSIGLNFSLLFNNPGSVSQYTNLANYNFSTSTFGSLTLSFQNGGTTTSTNNGTISSIGPAAVPEPHTAVAFIVLFGGAALLQRRRRGRVRTQAWGGRLQTPTVDAESATSSPVLE
jgi:hypothetical protein